jgi:hypothetical protein
LLSHQLKPGMNYVGQQFLLTESLVNEL